ncbi:MAG: diaminopimelate epimerase [Fimbriimonadaceae bacterium]
MSRVLVPFTKLETVGNDFILVNRAVVGDAHWEQMAIELCRRRYSVGSDGLSVIWREDGEIHLRFFNPDGTEDFCGNGLRCAAWYAYRQGWTNLEFDIHQLGKTVSMKIDPIGRVTAVMPIASYDPAIVPTLYGSEMIEVSVHGVVGTAVTTGSAHFVVLCDELPGDEEFFRLGPLIETDPVFPERVSVMWVRPDSDRHLTMRIWERGVGETLGCGTGATASASVWFRKMGLTGSVELVSKGGILEINMERWDTPISVECDPEEMYEGEALVSEKVFALVQI